MRDIRKMSSRKRNRKYCEVGEQSSLRRTKGGEKNVEFDIFLGEVRE